MRTENFVKLICAITKRELFVDSNDEHILCNKEYFIYKKLPLLDSKISFKFKTPTKEENILKAFISCFATKYLEPNPAKYNYSYGGKSYTWDEKTEKEKQFCKYHHKSFMYSKSELMAQITSNLDSNSILPVLLRYGFYETNYGIGIYCFYNGKQIKEAINKMYNYLKNAGIPFTNEFSDAKWVFRFCINLSKENHLAILNSFCKTIS